VDITVKMKDGSIRRFEHRPRAGGSWNLRLRYEGGFAIITDEYENDTAIPSADILEVQTHEPARW
jgi:hypothetical protein